MHTTSPSLLEKLFSEQRDHAWSRFVDLYAPLLLHWSRSWGMGDQAGDAVQQVFLVCLEKLPGFERRRPGSFRRWLHTVLENQCRALLRKSKPAESLDDRRHPSSANDVDAHIEAEYCSYVAHRALQLMESDFEEQTWQAFWKHKVEGLSAAECARQLNTSAGAVRVASTRVLRRLRTELDGLLD